MQDGVDVVENVPLGDGWVVVVGAEVIERPVGAVLAAVRAGTVRALQFPPTLSSVRGVERPRACLRSSTAWKGVPSAALRRSCRQLLLQSVVTIVRHGVPRLRRIVFKRSCPLGMIEIGRLKRTECVGSRRRRVLRKRQHFSPRRLRGGSLRIVILKPAQFAG